MSAIANILDRVKQNTRAVNARDRVPILLFGLGILSILAMAGWIFGLGNSSAALTRKQIAGICFSIGIFASAVGWDLSVGQRSVVVWLRDNVHDVRKLGKFALLTIELGLLVALIREFSIGNAAFSQVIIVLTFLGFCVNYFLPLRFRMMFFLLLSIFGLWAVLGTNSAAWLIGICLLMIGICHLPLRVSLRVGLLLICGGILAFCRVGQIHGPWPSVIWPIVGSILMFRLMVYLYDIEHSKDKISVPTSLAYFFLLPNVVFPLFPVVDYRTFRRVFYDADEHEIYQRGMHWIFRGITQLILYRFVYNYVTIAPAEVATVPALVRFLLANFSIYLRVSGSFHLIVGLLHLFGFHLPETNHRYFLSSSFNDFWRRINIYWREFMMKVFYYPAYFRLRKWGNTKALVISTVFIFVITWLLHGYQWFWLRGAFLSSSRDALFWGILGILVVANALYEMKHGRKRILARKEWSLETFAPVALRTVGTMSSICILWSLWTAMSLSEWLSLWELPGKKVASLGWQVTMLLAGLAVAGGVARAHAPARKLTAPAVKKPQFFRSALVGLIAFTAVYIAGNPAIYSHFGPGMMQLARSLRSDELNKRDAALVQRGYYEDLRVERFDSQLWDIYMKRPNNWQPIGETEAARRTGDLEWLELRPNSMIDFKGAPLHVNQWGMRDQDYPKEKLPGTYRYALLGASVTMGSGVHDNETFEALLEQRLNQENHGKGRYKKYEVLNFAVGGYGPLQYLWVVENKISAFQPDALLYTAHGNHDEERIVFFLTKFVREGVDLQYDYLKELVRRVGVDRSTPEGVAEKRLQPYAREIQSWIYGQIVQHCRKHGMVPVWFYLQTLEEWQMPKQSAAEHIRLAQNAGFLTIDLSDWFANNDVNSLKIAEWDAHPNSLGHKMIAELLYEGLRNKSKTVRLGGFTNSSEANASTHDVVPARSVAASHSPRH